MFSKLSTIAAAFLLLSSINSVLASPAPKPDPIPVPVPESPYDPNRPVTPGSSCTCKTIYDDAFPTFPSALMFDFHIPGQKMPSDQGTGDLGGGFLDNLRGQCGAVWFWTANDDNAGGFKGSFSIWGWKGTGNVQDAAWLASDPNNRMFLGCTGPCVY